MNQSISIAQPIIESEERAAVQAVLDSGNLTQGVKVAELEAAWASYVGVNYAVALNSGTAALHASLHAADIGPGDSVITTPFTFIASANSVLMQGANLKFVDVQPDSLNLNPNQLAAAYDDTVKAVLPVDLYGQPADYDEIHKFTDSHGLVLIEDACQAVGAEYDGKMVGSLGALACFSLYATKNIMSAEGGVLVTNDEAYAQDARSFRQHGMVGPYEYAQLGYNYRLTDILAALALAQLTKADRFNQARQQNAATLNAGLAGIDGLKLPRVRPNRTSVFHQYTLRLTADFPVSRSQFIDRLASRGVTAGVYYPKPLHAYPHIAKLGFAKGDFPVAEQAALEVVSLPVHPGLNEEQIDYMIGVIKEIAYA